MNYEHFMGKALDQAKKALSAGEFPVGCVMVHQDKIMATGSRKGTVGDFPNEVEHAEMIALKRLIDLKVNTDKNRIVLFTTLEPCLMCLGALILSGISEIVYAYEDVVSVEGFVSVPDDIDGDSGDPYATAVVKFDADANEYRYAFEFMSVGGYTLAFTCQAANDPPDDDDTIDFTVLADTVRVLDDQTTQAPIFE